MFPVYQMFYNNLPLTNNYAYIADANMCQRSSYLPHPLHLGATEFVIIPHSPHCLLFGCYFLSPNGLKCLSGGIPTSKIGCFSKKDLSCFLNFKCNHLFCRFNSVVKNQNNKSRGYFLGSKNFLGVPHISMREVLLEI